MVKADGNYTPYTSNPDALVNWDLIEQIVRKENLFYHFSGIAFAYYLSCLCLSICMFYFSVCRVLKCYHVQSAYIHQLLQRWHAVAMCTAGPVSCTIWLFLIKHGGNVPSVMRQCINMTWEGREFHIYKSAVWSTFLVIEPKGSALLTPKLPTWLWPSSVHLPF